jgi:hypothetical protein
MKKYQYFYNNDPKEEACGTLYAEDLNEATLIASKIKLLEFKDFIKIFNVKLL